MTVAEVELTGRQKSAALLITLGPEAASHVLKHFEEEEIELLSFEISQMGRVPGGIKERVLEECYHMSFVSEGVDSGGLEYARDMLARALGSQKAREFIERVRARAQGAPFDFLEDADPAQVANSLKNEHPQTIALIVSHLKASKAAGVIANLDEGLQGEVASRIAAMDRVSPDVIKDVETGVKTKLATLLVSQNYATAGGVSSLVSILHQVDRGTEKTIMDALDESQPQVAEEVRQKMFVFENIITLDDRAVQRILRDVDNKDLILALKGASEEVQDLIYRNLSKRAAQLLKEELAIMGPVRLKNVEEAQQRIVAVIRQLEAADEIVISRPGEDEVIT
ncbi:MAG TPA: flagellar motor switch protein FliG [Anaerolineae bacterium]|nr:flagellar motor switch protein FliG [Anaerolineae bacterium]